MKDIPLSEGSYRSIEVMLNKWALICIICMKYMMTLYELLHWNKNSFFVYFVNFAFLGFRSPIFGRKKKTKTSEFTHFNVWQYYALRYLGNLTDKRKPIAVSFERFWANLRIWMLSLKHLKLGNFSEKKFSKNFNWAQGSTISETAIYYWLIDYIRI